MVRRGSEQTLPAPHRTGQADFPHPALPGDRSVAQGRLGINNPDANGTVFSLRRELFRVLDDPTNTDDDARWPQTLEQHIVSNLLADPDVAAMCRNLRNADGSAVPGIVILFSTVIRNHQNFFSLPLVAGDHAFTPTNFATRLNAVGAVFRGYIGMGLSRALDRAAVPNRNTFCQLGTEMAGGRLCHASLP